MWCECRGTPLRWFGWRSVSRSHASLLLAPLVAVLWLVLPAMPAEAHAALARQAETKAHRLARDIRTLIQWLSHDVLALAGSPLVTRQMLFDFVVAELHRRESADERRIRPVRVALLRP